MSGKRSMNALNQWAIAAVALGWSGLGLALMGAVPAPSVPRPEEFRPSSAQEGFDRLRQMFSDDIQNTLNACWDEGRVDLAIGADAAGAVVCGDGSSQPAIFYSDYLDTVSDLLTASSLVGLQTVMRNDPRVTPEVLSFFAATEQGSQLLRTAVQTAIVRSGLQSPEASASADVLADAVVARLSPNVQDPQRFETLLGTSEQYEQVVAQFCTAPGLSAESARAEFPELDMLQLYAICIDQSGIADEALQMLGGR